MNATDAKNKTGSAAEHALDAVTDKLDAVGDKATPIAQEAVKRAGSHRTPLVIGAVALIAVVIALRGRHTV